MRPRSDLYPYQETGAQFIIEHAYCALWISMRLGKTAATLTALLDLFATFDIGKVLVVAPKHVAINSWPEDLEKWEHFQELTYTLVRGTPKQREKLCELDTDIHIIGRDSLDWLVNHWGKHWPYDTVVLDESRSFKNHASRRFKAMKKVLKHINRIIELTGTPSPNGIIDLWGQFYLLDRGRRLGKNVTAFRNRWFSRDYSGHGYKPATYATAQIEKLVADLVFVLEAGDYIDLPEIIECPIWFDLPDKAREIYDELEEELVVEVGKSEIIAPHVGAMLNKLSQIAIGQVYTNLPDTPKTWEVVHDEAYECLDELIETLDGAPLLLAYVYQFDKHKILARYKGVKLLDDNPQTIRDFQNGKIPILLLHPASGGHGLNLYGVARNICWFGLLHDLELFQQLNVRLSHPSIKEPINSHQILARGTYHADILKVLKKKDHTQKSIIQNIKNRMHKKWTKIKRTT